MLSNGNLKMSNQNDFANLAYGFLWLGETDDRRLHEARQLLLAVIGREGQMHGITQARLMMGINKPNDHGLQLREPYPDDVKNALIDTSLHS